MPKATGKQMEWEVAKAYGNPLFALFQDHDWADEVLHAQIGRKWLVPEFGSLAKLTEIGDELAPRIFKTFEKYLPLSEQKVWWTEFIVELRRRRDKLIQTGEHVPN